MDEKKQRPSGKLNTKRMKKAAEHRQQRRRLQRSHKRDKPGALLFFLTLPVILLFAAADIVFFGSRMLSEKWSDLTVDEIIFHLQNSFEGTNGSMAASFGVRYGLPAVLAFIVLVVMLVLAGKNRRTYRHVLLSALAVTVLFAGASFYILDRKLDLLSYFRYQGEDSTFIEDQYVDPALVEIEFPEKKRNLILIYLESMETTFADPASGGAFRENLIPELTALAMENEDFSGEDPALNGGLCLSGTTWTMGAIFGQTAGLPLKSLIGENKMRSQAHFFPGIRTLGDILADNGYDQYFLLGSNADFGGRRIYFRDHGDFTVYDYPYAKEAGLIPADYGVWWGYEDEKLFAFAKDMISEAAAKDAPFNFTILTVDTHFEDGYVCDLCRDDFAGNQYANVMACSSRQVTEFVSWIKDQDFFEDTTIILTGDHTTMDEDFCRAVPASYDRRTYTCLIGADAVPALDTARTYSTMDLFPTTLAALGCRIDGDRLGLGTNLYSKEKTLLETYSFDFIQNELAKNSAFLKEKLAVEINESLIEELHREAKFIFEPVEGEEDRVLCTFYMGYALNKDAVEKVEIECWSEGEPEVIRLVAPEDVTDYDSVRTIWLCYQSEYDLTEFAEGPLHFSAYVTTTDGQRILACEDILESP